MQRTGFMGEVNKPDKQSCNFFKLPFSLLIFSDENDIAKLVGDMWGNCFNKTRQLLYSWMRMNMIFKSSCLQMFYKIGVLKKFAKFKRKHLRPATMLKRDSSAGDLLWILRNF